MAIQEIDEFVSWVKCNVLDMPKTGDDMSVRGSDVVSNAEADQTMYQSEPRPTWAEMDAPTEYDFPLSLLENILGLDRV